MSEPNNNAVPRDGDNSNIDNDALLRNATEQEYKYGFTTDVDTDIVPPGLNEEVIRLISKIKGEPEWLIQFRLDAFRY